MESVAAKALYAAEFGYVWDSLRRLGVRGADLEDLSQEVFVRLFRNFASYDPSRPLRPWIFGIALRVASDFKRLAHRRHEIIQEPPETEHDAATPYEATEARQKQRLVLDALERVELDRRAIFILHDLESRPVPQIAEALGVPLNTCYSRLRLARNDFTAAVRALQGGAA
jgi:RNA polymerase sigma-70 factor (ECF subfamily)